LIYNEDTAEDHIRARGWCYTVPVLVYYLLPWLELMREGEMPQVDYRKADFKSYRVSHAKHENACSIAGDIDRRLKRVPKGDILIDKFTRLKTNKELCKKYNFKQQNLEEEINARLKYISGKKDKVEDYQVWYRDSWLRRHDFLKQELNV
jgi:hypothetical protein